MIRNITVDEKSIQKSLDYINDQIRNLTTTKNSVQKSLDMFEQKKSNLEKQLVDARNKAAQKP